jgi:sporulation inhibitor KapD
MLIVYLKGRRVMGKQQYLFIDFEFTMPEGKNNPDNFFQEIIEVGIVSVIDNKINSTFSSYVKPKFFPILTDRCKKFLKVTQKQINEGISFKRLCEVLTDYNKEETTIITWGNLDIKVLGNCCNNHNIPYPLLSAKYRDLAIEHKRFFGDKNQTGLRRAIELYGDEAVGKAHTALDDAVSTYQIFKLIENDKQYLVSSRPTTIGERIDLSKIKQKLANK